MKEFEIHFDQVELLKKINLRYFKERNELIMIVKLIF